MNILIINWSSRKTGTTASITKTFIKAAKGNGADIRSHHLNYMRDIHGCQSFTKCYETGHCAVQDDFPKALADHHRADIIVWTTPVYIDDMSCILKLFTDRILFSNVKPVYYQEFDNPIYRHPAAAKKLILLQTQAAPANVYKTLFEKCTIIMRKTGVHDYRWLECNDLWIDEDAFEGQSERLQKYESNAINFAQEVCP